MRAATSPSRRLGARGAAALALSLCALAPAGAARGAVPPEIGAIWASKVEARSAVLSAEVNANGSPTVGSFEYATKAAYEASGFAGAKKVNFNSIGSSNTFIKVSFPTISGLETETTYVYRLTVSNGGGQDVEPLPSDSPPYRYFVTQPLGGGSFLPDGRSWEMVSPVQKNGGDVAMPGAIAGGGLLQAAAGGGAVTYSSAASFEGGAGAPPASQYIASRNSEGWSAQNVVVPVFSGSYDIESGGAPYRIFSTDLARGLLLNGKSCRSDATSGCPVANPVLPGTDAPPGYQDYYLRTTATGTFEALLGAPDIAGLGLDASAFELRLVGASTDLSHVILASCSKLTASASDGCPSQESLYEWSAGGALSLINASPGAALAAQSGAVSANGARVYFYEGADLWVRDGAALKQADADAGGGGAFQTASADGSLAYFTKAGHLYRYNPTSDVATDLTPSGGVLGVLGAAQDGSNLYYLSASGLWLCQSAASAANCESGAVEVTEDADEGNYPPATGTARVSADGRALVFVASVSLTGYDNTDLFTHQPDSQVYLYEAGGDLLTCVSCNPTNARPIGPSSIPGAIANGTGPTATDSYKPRVLVDGGRRVFFDSADAIGLADVNSNSVSGQGIDDVYQWEAQGEGDCVRPAGCQALISSGRDPGGARFADASADGADAFLLTGASLVKADPGGVDLYDARIGGGFTEPPVPIPCEGDACQVLPPEPEEPTLTTLLTGPGNPPVRYVHYKHRFKIPKKKQGRHHRHSGTRSHRGGHR